MDKLVIVQLIIAFLFLFGLFMAMSARIEVGRLRSRVTELEDRVRQLLAILDAERTPPESPDAERPG